MLSIEEIREARAELVVELNRTQRQLDELDPADPDHLRPHLEDDVARLEDEIDTCDNDICHLEDED